MFTTDTEDGITCTMRSISVLPAIPGRIVLMGDMHTEPRSRYPFNEQIVITIPVADIKPKQFYFTREGVKAELESVEDVLDRMEQPLSPFVKIGEDAQGRNWRAVFIMQGFDKP